MNLITYVQIQM